MRKNKITLAQVAKQAEVSISSASMILTGKRLDRFNAETIDKVKAAAKELNYNPKALKNNVILIVCPTIFNPYYSKLIQSIDMKATEKGLNTMIFNTYWDLSRESQLVEIAKNPKFCGVIFAMIPQQFEIATTINNILPVVAIGDKVQNLGIDLVHIDNVKSGKILAKHLMELNHKKLAYISTSLNNYHSSRVNRLKGIQAYYPDILVYSKDINPSTEINNVSIEYDTGYYLAKKCIEQHKDITAIVAMNDMIAYGVINAIKDLDYEIPNDISVCGFDNIFPSMLKGISLTTIDHCIIDKGKKAVSLLNRRLKNEEDNTTIVEYKSKLIQRKSTSKV